MIDASKIARFCRAACCAVALLIVPAARPASPPGLTSHPVSPADSLAKIHVPPGFSVELIAAEPLLESPVAIDWDARGRLWVAEMVDYPMGLDNKGAPGGRVRVLEDADGDGRYDMTTLFADGLRFPTGILPWRDGVLVTCAPEILFLKDTNGDGHADIRQVLFSGFIQGNQQLRVNGLRWGVDNWVYCASGAHHGGFGANTRIKSHLTSQEIPLGSHDFRFKPDTGEIEILSGPSQFGRNTDGWGNWFGVQNSWPLWHYVLEERYLRRNPYLAAPDPTHQVVTPKNPKVYPASSQEKRYHSFEEGGHFTSACAAMIYRDEVLFGPSADLHSFTCEPFHNVVQHNVVEQDGVSFRGHRAVGEEKMEFFASEDRWCRPVMTRTGPDGALWVVDMYRYMIEHPEWLPAEGREELLPHYRAGEDRGRIYRVFPQGQPRSKWTRLEGKPTPELVAALEASNGWQRDTAQQLLLWRADQAAVAPLLQLARSSTNPAARLHALGTLAGLGALRPELIQQALTDPHPGLRVNALRFAEAHRTTAITAAALKLVDDPDPKVRLQLACTLGEWNTPEAGDALGRLAAAHYRDPYFAAAILSSAVPHARELVDHLLAEHGPALEAFSDPLVTLALAVDERTSLARLLEPSLTPALPGAGFSSAQMQKLSAFLDTLARRNRTLSDLEAKLRESINAVFPIAQELLKDAAAPARDRLAAAALLARVPERRLALTDLLEPWLSPKTPGEQLVEALKILGLTSEPGIPALFAKAWPSLPPEARLVAIDQYLSRPPWALDLARRVASGEIPPGAFDPSRRGRLLRHSSAEVRDVAAKAFETATPSSRVQVLEQFQPALALEGDARRGAAVHARLCAVCHKLGGVGNEIGPDLKSVSNHPPEKLLVSILDPNAAVEVPTYTATLAHGEEVYGLIASETGNSLVFKLANGTTRNLLRHELTSLRGSNLSLMPEGLEAGLTPQDLADLIRFLRTPQP